MELALGSKGCMRPRTTSWSEMVTLVCQYLSLSVMVPNDFPYQKTLGVTTKTSLYHVQNQSYNFTPWRCACPPTAPPSCYCLFSSSKSQMISHTKKPWVWHQKQVSSIFRTKVGNQVSQWSTVHSHLHPHSYPNLHKINNFQVSFIISLSPPKIFQSYNFLVFQATHRKMLLFCNEINHGEI